MKLDINDYGFVWGEVLVQRTMSQEKSKKTQFFQILSVYTPNGQIVELMMTKRKNKITIIPKAK